MASYARPTKIAIVDDHPVVRDGLKRLTELSRDIIVVGDAGSMAEALKMCLLQKPDIVLMDVRMPDGDGIEACRRIKAACPGTSVLFLTSYADNRFVLSAIESGAEGYLLKENSAQRIVEAIFQIRQGKTVFDPIPSARLTRNELGSFHENPLSKLSTREHLVLTQVALGKTDKEVASTLGLTPKTARNYLDRIFGKLQVHTRTEAAILFARHHAQVPGESQE